MATASDDFERSTGLGANWTVNTGPLGIANNSDLAFGGALGIAIWAANTFGPNQFCEGTLVAGWDTTSQASVCVRRQASDEHRYGFHWNNSTSEWELKYDGGSGTVVLATTSAFSRPVGGDTLRIEVVDSTITGYKNGVQVLRVMDTRIDGVSDTPRPALVMAKTGNAVTIPVWESWNGGDLAFSLDTVLSDADITTTGWSTAPLFSKINDSSDSTVITATAS